ncbi:MAG: hypothetical protein AAGG54_09900 [Pseudomonadota bacterium]
MRAAWIWLAVIVLPWSATPIGSQVTEPRIGPSLSAASNFSQGRQDGMFRLVRALGLADLRDGMTWSRVETAPGMYRFDNHRTRYPAQLADTTIGVVLNWGNPLYDGGATPVSDEALGAFGRYAAALIEQYPNIENLEIGNEINGVNFVRGPMREMAPLERARAYTRMIIAAAEAAKAVRPDIRIVGGATHSLPGAFLWEVLDAGGAEVMDAIAVHPYTTPAEQLQRQFAVLRRHPDAARLPFEVTEFGTPDPDQAAAHFVRNYCQMALSSVTRVAWYPLNRRGDGMIPIVEPDGRLTGAGRALRLIQSRMEGRPVRDIAPDPFTYGCQFGDDTAVLWGVPRAIEGIDGLELRAADGSVVEAAAFDEATPLILIGDDPVAQIRLAGQTRLADSFHQFSYPDPGDETRDTDGFERFILHKGSVIAFETRPGQDARGTPWYPYLGVPRFRPMRLTAENMVPGVVGGSPAEIVHRYVASEDVIANLTARFAVGERSEDGIVVTVLLDGDVLVERDGIGEIEVLLPGLPLAAGAALDIIVGPKDSARGDVVQYRLILDRG